MSDPTQTSIEDNWELSYKRYKKLYIKTLNELEKANKQNDLLIEENIQLKNKVDYYNAAIKHALEFLNMTKDK